MPCVNPFVVWFLLIANASISVARRKWASDGDESDFLEEDYAIQLKDCSINDKVMTMVFYIRLLKDNFNIAI